MSGTVAAREVSVNGYRLILDHLSFAAGDNAASGPGQSVVKELNGVISPKDRLQVFLSDGASENGLSYGGEDAAAGDGESGWEDDWMHSSPGEDQTELFDSVRIGDRVSLYGRCRQPELPSNPGQFDSRRYCLARRIVLKMNKVRLCALQRPQSGALRQALLWHRNRIAALRIGMQMSLRSVYGRQDASQIAAFLLGDSSGMDPGTQQLFRNGGMSWLVCVSSLHISLLGMMLYRLLRSRGIPFVPSGAAASCIVASYALLTGFSLSAQRALVTFLVWTGAQVFGRTRDTLSSLSAAASVILIRQPLALWDSSFLMSFACILSLEYVAPAALRIFRPHRPQLRRLCSSVSLWIGTLPCALWFFYQVTPYGSVLYPVLLPLMSLFLGFGLLGSMGGYLFRQTGMPVLLAAGKSFAWPCRILLGGLRFVCALEAELPGGVVILGRPEIWQMLAYYGVLAAFVLWTRRRRRPRTSALVLFGLLIVLISLRRRPFFRYTCLDIGQGSCSLIEHKGSAYLFDAGSSSVDEVWRYRIDSTLKYYGIRRVEIVFLSHGDMDHTDGIEQMLELYHPNLLGQNAGDVTIGRILIPQLPLPDDRLGRVAGRAEEHGIEVCSIGEGAVIGEDDMTMEILSPSPGRITGSANEDCTVMLLRLMNLQILFTGDLEKEGEEMFVRDKRVREVFDWRPEGTDEKMTILIAGHHGSKNATSDELLCLVKPDLVLISCGKNNRYGHPAPAMLKRLEDAGIPYRRTDLEGALEVVCS